MRAYWASSPAATAHPWARPWDSAGPPGTPFHSHIVGLLPESTGRGLGRAIKLHQRAWCLERGIAEMTWTFDPLVGRNAYFNIQRLGARPVEYLPEFYGAMNDSINSGQLSDRMLMRWDLTTEPPAPGEAQSALGPVGAHDAVADIDGRPSGYRAPPDTRATVTLAVPRDVEGLRRKDAALAHEWRSETRAAFAQLFARAGPSPASPAPVSTFSTTRSPERARERADEHEAPGCTPPSP